MYIEEFEKIISSNHLSKKAVLDAVEQIFAKETTLLGKRPNRLLFVDKELKAVPILEEAAAVVASVHKNEEIVESTLDDPFFDSFHFNKRFINIAFLEPIGHNATLHQSVVQTQEWQKEHYPQYHATLISCFFSSMAQEHELEAFDNCWLRELENEGYPQYRNHPTYAHFRYVSAYEKLPNVYASLVMTEEEFKKLNPQVELAKYYGQI